MPPRDDLEMEWDLAFHRREWRTQRILWGVFGVFLLLAALGLFGNGPLEERTATAEAGGVAVELTHPRWTRYGYPQALELVVRAPGASGNLTARFEGAFTEKASLENLEPPGADTAVLPGGWSATWKVEDWREPVRVLHGFRTDAYYGAGGRVTVQAGDRAGPAVAFEMFVYP